MDRKKCGPDKKWEDKPGGVPDEKPWIRKMNLSGQGLQVNSSGWCFVDQMDLVCFGGRGEYSGRQDNPVHAGAVVERALQHRRKNQ